MSNRWIGIACIAMMAAGSALAYSHLPEKVPTHWNIHGEVDGYSSPELAVVFMPVLAALLWALMRVLARFDPISKRQSTDVFLSKVANWLAAFLLMVHLATLGVGIGLRLNLGQIVVLSEGALLMLIGNEMGRLRRNSWAGIRVPWTLTDDENWRRTHRVSARAFVLAGAASMLAALVFSGSLLFAIVVAAGLGASIFAVGYSYRLALQKRSSQQQ